MKILGTLDEATTVTDRTAQASSYTKVRFNGCLRPYLINSACCPSEAIVRVSRQKNGYELLIAGR